MSDLRRALEELHKPYKDPPWPDRCDADETLWPCETARLLAAHPVPQSRPVVDREALREAAIEAVSARLHITSDQIMTGGSPRQLVADTTAVHEAVDAVLALLDGPCICPTDADVTPDMRSETRQHLLGCPLALLPKENP